MSTNIHISAEREVLVTKTGKISTQSVNFDTWQTPSNVTHQIMKSEDKVQAYKDWVLSITQDVVEPVYGDYALFYDEPIGTIIYNAGKEHVAKLDKWIRQANKEGYDVVLCAR